MATAHRASGTPTPGRSARAGRKRDGIPGHSPLTEVVKRALYRIFGTAGITRRLQVQHLPVLDGLVAATAAVAGLTLATRNTLHMQHTGAVVFDPWTGYRGSRRLRAPPRAPAPSPHSGRALCGPAPASAGHGARWRPSPGGYRWPGAPQQAGAPASPRP